MPEIRRIGSYQETDGDGFLVKSASPDNISGEWKEMVSSATELCVSRWNDALHSVYARGSVAKGLAIPSTSDIDMVVVLQDLQPDEAAKWSRKTESELEARFPDTGGFEVLCLDKTNVLTYGTPDSVLIKLECVCVHGENLSEEIPPYRLGQAIALQMQHFRTGLDVFENEYPRENPKEKHETMSWLMRRFLRTGMEMVMVEEQRFTRDLYLCYESFSKHYPSREREMYRVLELAVNPAPSPQNDEFIRDFGEWMNTEVSARLTGWSG